MSMTYAGFVTGVELRTSPAAALIREHRLIVVLRHVDLPELTTLVGELADTGGRIFEITMDRPDAAAAMAACRSLLPAGALLGAGTVRTREQLQTALDSGADFAVGPILDLEILEAALEGGLPFIPAGYTPTEVDQAWRHGATFVKLFPASSLGPGHVRELRGPLSEIEVIATGGIDATNAAAYLSSGAVAVGIGSAMVAADPAGRKAILKAVRGAQR